MSIVLANNAKTTLSADISSIATTISVDSTSSFPVLGVGDYFNCTIESTSGAYEIVRVTQVNSTSFNVTRAQENTIAVPFSSGARVELRDTVQNLKDQINLLISGSVLSVGTIASQNANNVNITGGLLTGLTRIDIGANPNVDSSAPGANGFNVNTTSTGTATTPYQFGSQFYHGIAPATTSTSIFRGLYVRSETLNNSDITEMIGLSSYQYHSGTGTIGTQYGATLQTRLFGAGTIISAQGALIACRIGDTGGLYNNGRGATASAISDKVGGGIAFNFATGLYSTARITADSVMTDATANENELLLEASGGSMGTARATWNHATLAAGSSISTMYLSRNSISNAGTITTAYYNYMAAPTGAGTISTKYGLFAEPGLNHYLGGNLGIGDSTPTEGSLVVEQGSNTAVLYLRRTANDANPIQVTTEAKNTSPAANDSLFNMSFSGYNSTATNKNYVQMAASIVSPTAGAEYGRWTFSTLYNGASSARWRIGGGFYAFATNDQGPGTVNASAGYYMNDGVVISSTKVGTFAAGTTINGANVYIVGGTDVAIADGGTGASTAAAARTNLGSTTVGDALFIASTAATARTTLGSTTVGDALFIAASAASARSTLGLDTANNPQFATIELGAATDTTISRSSAGNIAVEGNLVYRAGGTDVPVADGGTGASTAILASQNLGTTYVLKQDFTQHSVTGTLVETTLATIALPAGAMGNNGSFRIRAYFSYTNSANIKTLRMKLGATEFLNLQPTTTATMITDRVVGNRNSASSQVAATSGLTAQFGSTTGALTTMAENTGGALNITITGQLANTGETITLEGYLVELCYGV